MHTHYNIRRHTTKIAISKYTATNTGHDIKSLLINLATALLFFLPGPLYFGDEDQIKMYLYVLVGSFVVCLLAPPMGWMRPHPYTDIPGNEPLTFRKDN